MPIQALNAERPSKPQAKDLTALLALFLLRDILIEQLPDHFLILRMVLLCSFFEKRHTLRTQSNRDFGLLILQCQFFG